jgi:hypothetical protein
MLLVGPAFAGVGTGDPASEGGFGVAREPLVRAVAAFLGIGEPADVFWGSFSGEACVEGCCDADCGSGEFGCRF